MKTDYMVKLTTNYGARISPALIRHLTVSKMQANSRSLNRSFVQHVSSGLHFAVALATWTFLTKSLHSLWLLTQQYSEYWHSKYCCSHCLSLPLSSPSYCYHQHFNYHHHHHHSSGRGISAKEAPTRGVQTQHIVYSTCSLLTRNP